MFGKFRLGADPLARALAGQCHDEELALREMEENWELHTTGSQMTSHHEEHVPKRSYMPGFVMRLHATLPEVESIPEDFVARVAAEAETLPDWMSAGFQPFHQDRQRQPVVKPVPKRCRRKVKTFILVQDNELILDYVMREEDT